MCGGVRNPKVIGIADVEVPDLPAGGFHLLRLGDDVADGVDEAADAGGNRDDARTVREAIAESYRDGARPDSTAS